MSKITNEHVSLKAQKLTGCTDCCIMCHLKCSRDTSWRGTDFNSCQVSAIKMCVASRRIPLLLFLGSDLITKPPLPPLDILANTQAQSDGKVRGKPLYQVQQMHRNVRPTQETYAELLTTTRFLFPPDWRPQWFLHRPNFTLSQ